MSTFYVYPNGDAYDAEDWTLDELITSGHSDDCMELEVPEDVDCPYEWCYQQVMEVNLGDNCERQRSTQAVDRGSRA